MTAVGVPFVDLYVLREAGAGLQALVLRRAVGERCPGSWECVHGSIEAGETPVAAARRELVEETGLVPERLYNLSRVEAFYRHGTDDVALIPVFVAFVGASAAVTLSDEHDLHEWLAPAEALARYSWPRARRSLEDALALVGGGTAGPMEDVLRIC